MNIKKVEQLTGISKQNIRFYEKQGLITPKRNKINSYREYTEEEILKLKKILLLRKIGITIEETGQILDQKISFGEAIALQRKHLEEEKRNLEAAIKICKELEPWTINELDVDLYLEKIESESAKGSFFFDIIQDYRKVARAEKKRSFSFRPNTLIVNSKEFTDELLNYARENKQDIIILKESMYPEFCLDGVVYSACRGTGRFGAVVYCEVKDWEKGEAGDVPEDRREKLKILYYWLPAIIVFLITLTFIKSLLLASTFALIFGSGSIINYFLHKK